MTTKELWLSAPENQVANVIKDMIQEKWDDDPTAIQILEVVDHCVYYGASSDFVVSALNLMLEGEALREDLDYDDLIKAAVWRNDHA